MLFGLTFELGADLIGVIVDLFAWIGPKGTGIALAIITVLGWLAAMPEAISIAARRSGGSRSPASTRSARGLPLESPQSFHRRLMRIDLPAPAQFVMRGALAGRREGRLVLCRWTPRDLSAHYDAVVFEAPGLEGEGAAAAPNWRLAGGHLDRHRAGRAPTAAPRASTRFASAR